MFDFKQDPATNSSNPYFPFFSTVSEGEHMDSIGPWPPFYKFLSFNHSRASSHVNR